MARALAFQSLVGPGTPKPLPADADWLQSVRLASLSLPADATLDLRAVSIDHAAENRLWHELIGRFPSTPSVAGRIIAFDLDETLISSDHVMQEAWDDILRAAAIPAFDRRHLSLDLVATARGWLRGRFQVCHSRELHPFLKNPKVFIALRPGTIGCLRGLRSLGVRLVLVTASARRRVDWLLARIPELAEVFTHEGILHVVAAEDLARTAPAEHTSPLWAESASLHRAHPCCISAKSPWRVAEAIGVGGYDLLIDDSPTIADIFRTHGLGHRLLSVSPGPARSSCLVPWVGDALTRLAGLASQPLHFVTSPPPRPVVLEDPWYLPLVHTRDRPAA